MEATPSAANPRWLSITGQPLNLDFHDGFLGACTSISNFDRLNELGQGAYGVVLRARDRRTSRVVALKSIRVSSNKRDGPPDGISIPVLREISILRSLQHRNIVNVLDIAVGSGSEASPNSRAAAPASRKSDHGLLNEIYMVMEYAQQDLAVLLDEEGIRFKLGEVKCLFRQLLEGLEYLHHNNIIHRDLKPENLLLTSNGVLKIADFSLSRSSSSRAMTPDVVTIWYRAPELLFGARHYDASIDIWSAGTILAELLLSEPLFPGEGDVLEQRALIENVLGPAYLHNRYRHDPPPSSPSAEAGSRDTSPSSSSSSSSSSSNDSATPRRQKNKTKRDASKIVMTNLARLFPKKAPPSQTTLEYLTRFLTWHPQDRWTASEALGRMSRGAGDAGMFPPRQGTDEEGEDGDEEGDDGEEREEGDDYFEARRREKGEKREKGRGK